jgi:RNA polymerase sigma factor (sigma-70 family)
MCILQDTDRNKPERFECAQAGCPQCLEALLERHRGLIHAVIREQWTGGVAYADLEQEGLLGLWRAIMSYDPARGWAFSTYAWVAIKRHIWQIVARWEKKTGLYILANTPNPLTLAEKQLDVSQRDTVLREMVLCLPPRLRLVIWAAYGLDGDGARSLAAIGRELGISRERVRQLRNEALRQLRRPERSGSLWPGWAAERSDYQYMQRRNRHCLRQRRRRRS